MNLLTFLLGKKLKSFYSAGNWKTLLGVLVMGAILLLYAVGAAYLYDQYTIKHATTGAALIINSIKVTLVVLPLTLKFFPSIAFKKSIIAANYPVSTLKIAFIDFFATCFIKANNWLLFVFVMMFSIGSITLGASQIYILLCYWLAGFLLAENIINAISWRKFTYLFFTFLLLAVVLILIKYPAVFSINNRQLYLNLILITIILVLFASFFAFYQRSIEQVNSGAISYQSAGGALPGRFLYLKVLYNNRKFRLSILIALCLKAGFLGLFLTKSDRLTFTELLDKVPFLLLLQTPVILFTYAYNNIWGYFKDIELNNLVADSSLKRQATTYLSLLWPALLVDGGVSAIVFGFFGLISFKLITLYMVFCAYGAVIGFLSSFRKYFFVDFVLSFGSFRVKTSTTYSALLIIPAFAAGFVYAINVYFFALLFLLLTASFALAWYISAAYTIHLKKLKDSFFNLKPVGA